MQKSAKEVPKMTYVFNNHHSESFKKQFKFLASQKNLLGVIRWLDNSTTIYTRDEKEAFERDRHSAPVLEAKAFRRRRN